MLGVSVKNKLLNSQKKQKKKPATTATLSQISKLFSDLGRRRYKNTILSASCVCFVLKSIKI